MIRLTVALSTALGLFALIHLSDSCNEAVCASIVSKCMITQSCKCDLKNCSCCKECFNCLNHLYSECCSCVEMCPKPNLTVSALSRKSHVEDLPDALPSLFQTLTSEQDTLQRWLTVNYPVDLDIGHLKPHLEKEYKIRSQNDAQEVDPLKNKITLNCSVAFMSQCMSWNKCKASCQSMGASSYRWFHDGCCECVGDQCINYGINESRCRDCPLNEDEDVEGEPDYGDEDDSVTM